MKSFYKKGITVIELLVVLVVLGVIFSVATPQFSKMRENQVLKNGVQDILSSLDKAHSQTLASLNSSVYGVRFEADKVIIFTGTYFDSEAIDNKIINIVAPATISKITLNSINDTSGEMYFNRLSGSPSKIGTVTISTTNYSKIITIWATGMASVN